MRRVSPVGALIVVLVTCFTATAQASGQAANMRVVVSVSPGCSIAVTDPLTDNDPVALTCSRDTYPVVTLEEIEPAESATDGDEATDIPTNTASESEPATAGAERPQFRVAVINF